MESLAQRIGRVASAPMASLVDPIDQAAVGPQVERWDLPESDKAVLRKLGLPAGPLLRPAPQLDADPVLVPNVPSERERRLIAPDQRLYRLGTYGGDSAELTIQVGAVACTGEVLGIRSRPITTEDIHPQLRNLYPGLYHPSVTYFNASVRQFVEIAWRWYAAVDVLRRHADDSPDPAAPFAFQEAHFEAARQAGEQFLAAMVEVDGTLADPDRDSLWVETFTNDL